MGRIDHEERSGNQRDKEKIGKRERLTNCNFDEDKRKNENV